MLPQHPFYAFKGPLCSHLPSLLQAQGVCPVSSQGSPLSFRTSWLSQTQAPSSTSYPFYLSHSVSPTSPSVSNQKDPQVSSSPKQNLKKNTFFLAFSSLAIFLNAIYTSFVPHPLLSPYHMPSRLLKAFSPSRWVILLVRPFCPSHTTDHTLLLSCLFPGGYWFLSFLFSISVMVSYH